MSAAAARQELDFGGATISDVEEVLRIKSSWCNLMMKLFYILLGITMSFYSVLASGVTRPDRITINVVSCVIMLLGAGLICWDVYVRVHLEYMVEIMRCAALDDLESPGEQS